MKVYLMSVITNPFFLLFITAALGAALGSIKIKGFSLGSAAGIFSGIFVGWAIIAICKTIPEGGAGFSQATNLIENGVFPSSVNMLFLILFICSIGLSVGGKIKSVLNKQGLKLVFIGIIIPVISMALTFGCLKLGPALMGDNFNGYEISGLYTGAMTNTAAYGTSMEVVGNIDVPGRYAELSDEEKTRALEMIGAEDTTPTDHLEGEQIGAFYGKAKSHISLGYAISFPVGTVVIILAMTILSIILRKNKKLEYEATVEAASPAFKHDNSRPVVFNAVVFGIVIVCGIILGNIKIPLGGGANFSLGAVGGVLISALVFSNIPKLGPIDMSMSPKALAFVREMSLILFMSIIGLTYGYSVVESFSGSGLVLAIMALVIETIAILIAIGIGRLFKLSWGLLSGAICGGCTSAVGLGAAIKNMGSDETTIGYGLSQPFAILANVLLISYFHNVFFI